MNTAKQVSQSAKQLARDVARKMAQEPLEILKEARGQVSGEDTSFENPQAQAHQDSQYRLTSHQNELQDKMKSSRLMEAFNRELSDIQKQELFKDLQRRISEGETIPVEDFQELSYEQRDVLKAQMEAVKIQMQNAKNSNAKSELLGSSKPGRRFGQKQQAQREQTRVEKPIPPSG